MDLQPPPNSRADEPSPGFRQRVAASPGFWALAGSLFLLDFCKSLCLFAFGQTQPWWDAPGYWEFAGDAAGGDFWLWKSQLSFRTPGYPWVVGLIRWLAGARGLMATVGLQLGVNAVISILVGKFVARSTGYRGWGLLAYASCICGMNRSCYATSVLTETFASALFTLTVLALLEALSVNREGIERTRSRNWFFAAVLCLGGGILVRPAGLSLLIPALIAWCMLPRKNWLEAASQLGVAGLILAVMLVPWCLRNQQLTGRFTLCNFSGRQLWTTTFSPSPGAGLSLPETGAAGEIRERIQQPGKPLDVEWNWVISKQLTASGLTDAEADALMFRAAFQTILGNPVRACSRGLYRCVTFWTCWEWPTNWEADAPGTERFYTDQTRWSQPELARIGRQLIELSPGRSRWGTYLLNAGFWLCLLGCLWRPATRKLGFVVAAAMISTNLLTAAGEIPVYRYRMILEPLMVLTAIITLAELRTQKRRL